MDSMAVDEKEPHEAPARAEEEGPPMAPPLEPQLTAPPPPPTRNAQQVGAILRTQAVRAPRPAIVRHATLDLELAALNADLGALGLTYRVPDAAAMRAVKRAAGQANTTTPASDYAQLETAVVRALYLGALGGADVRPPEQQRFADEFRAAIIDEVPDRARQLRAKAFTFGDCEQYAARVTEEPITGMLPKSLARKVAASLGHGNLQGIFPGEQLEATHEQAGPGRLDRMNELGREIVRLLAAEVGDVKPELTGSIVLVGGGYTGVPEDLDINVTTRGTVQQRAE